MAYHFHQVLVLWLKGITFKRPLPPPCFSWPYAYLLLSFYKGIIFLCKAHKSCYSSPMLESTSLTRCLRLGLGQEPSWLVLLGRWAAEETATASSLVSSAWWCQHAVSPSMLPLRMPQVLFREDKGTRVRLAISRHSVRQGEGRMPVALSPCGPVHPNHKFWHQLYRWVLSSLRDRAPCCCRRPMHSKRWAGAGTAPRSLPSGQLLL